LNGLVTLSIQDLQDPQPPVKHHLESDWQARRQSIDLQQSLHLRTIGDKAGGIDHIVSQDHGLGQSGHTGQAPHHSLGMESVRTHPCFTSPTGMLGDCLLLLPLSQFSILCRMTRWKLHCVIHSVMPHVVQNANVQNVMQRVMHSVMHLLCGPVVFFLRTFSLPCCIRGVFLIHGLLRAMLRNVDSMSLPFVSLCGWLVGLSTIK
jgi:hypothetical protein